MNKTYLFAEEYLGAFGFMYNDGKWARDDDWHGPEAQYPSQEFRGRILSEEEQLIASIVYDVVVLPWKLSHGRA